MGQFFASCKNCIHHVHVNKSRFTSVALLDESAVLSYMAYVDLNPIRAGIVEQLQQSLYTSVKKRLKQLQSQPELLNKSIQPITNGVNGRAIQVKLNDYIELVEWAGKSIIHPNKSVMPAKINTLLINMNLQPDNWLNQIKILNKDSPHSIGCLEKLRERAKHFNKKWIKCIGVSQLLYSKP